MLTVVQFLDAYNIEYVSTGPNVARNNVNIKCPFCGSDDPSNHLGVRLDWSAWGCWRDSTHRGKSPFRLVAKLLGISNSEAKKVLKVSKSYLTDDDEFLKSVNLLNGVSKSNQKHRSSLQLPEEFKPIKDKLPNRIADYLSYRGYKEKDYCFLQSLDLGYAITGFWKDRLIFPIYQNGSLKSWTARSVYDNTRIKYMTLSNEKSLVGLDKLMWPYDFVNKEGKMLVVCEGVFDALRINYHFAKKGVRAIALLGKVVTKDKCLYLNKLSRLYYNTTLLLDGDTYIVSDDLSIIDRLSFVPKVCKIEDRYPGSDPADLSKGQLARLFF